MFGDMYKLRFFLDVHISIIYFFLLFFLFCSRFGLKVMYTSSKGLGRNKGRIMHDSESGVLQTSERGRVSRHLFSPIMKWSV